MPERTSSFSFPWQFILPLMAAVSGALLFLKPLITDRPPAKQQVSRSIGHADVDARLWQDPFKAVMDRPSDSGSTFPYYGPLFGRDRRQELINAISERLQTTFFSTPEVRKARVLVLPVMVSAAGYAEFAEQRLRTRVAVLSALARCGYNPEDTAHIGFFDEKITRRRLDGVYPYENDADKATLNKINSVVPYEWLRPASMKMPISGVNPWNDRSPQIYDNVLILWLNEDLLMDRPLYRLVLFLNGLLTPVKGQLSTLVSREPPEHLQNGLEVKVIGPRTSTVLRAMAWERSRWKENPIVPIHFLCPTATADSNAILANDSLDDVHQEDPKNESIEDIFKIQPASRLRPAYRPFTWLRVTASDGELCKTLVTELGNRNINVRHSGPGEGGAPADRDDVAVIAEWDTFFGRALSLSFAAECSGYTASDLSVHPEHYPKHVHPFVYLRGIDGQTAVGDSNLKPDKAADKSGEKTVRPVDPPEGTDQSDYLRRLAAQLSELDDRLRRDGRRLTAVGVLGTDVYDKLMILRALRAQLPGVVFFTTDLDARYAMPTEWQATHNLVIAAGYGQRLGRFYQGGVPPFRDSPQTATYAATLTAVGLIKESKFGSAAQDGVAFNAPRLFEIARDGSYDLSETSPANESPDETDSVLVSIHPPRANLISWFEGRHWKVGMFVIILILAALAITIFQPTEEKTVDMSRLTRALWKNNYVFLVCLFLFVTLLAKLFQGMDHASAEPFSFTNGISVWPTEIIRVVVIILVCRLLIHAEAQRRRNNFVIERQFRFLRPSGIAAQAEPVMRRRVDASVVWWRYRSTSETDRKWWLSNRFRFSVVFSILFVGIAWTILSSTGMPFSPVRGRWASRVDQCTFLLIVACLSFFTIFVSVGSLTIHRFIRDLMSKPTRYSRRGVVKLFPAARDLLKKYINDKHEREAITEDFAEAMDVRLIALRTEAVGRSMYYLLFAYTLILLGRSSLFDDWDWPVGLVIIFALTGTAAMLAAVFIRKAAEDARQKSLASMEQRRIRRLATGDNDRVKVIERLIEGVIEERRGAFAVLSQYPWLSAIIVPSGGLGVWVLLEYLPQWLN